MIQNHDNDIIVAQCTPQGSGALALLRVCGDQAIAHISSLCSLPGNKKLIDQPTHTIHYGSIVNDEGIALDHCMFIVMQGPRTFTGQNTVEITTHNNPFIIEAIIQQIIKAGARLAQPGEFSRRAVLNNKIDLLQAEAINELIHAHTPLALKQALAQVDGTFSSWVVGIEKELIKALAFSEASFEFIEEEELEFGSTIKAIILDVLGTIKELKHRFHQQQHIRQGVRIALIGSVNAGKSSLFNALLNKNRAIVTNIPGTTRDALEAGIYTKNNYWTLIDTAGLRQTDDIIEQEGISRSLQEASCADIVVLVVDRSRGMTLQERTIYEELLVLHSKKVIVVHTKPDLPAYPNPSLSVEHALEISTITRKNMSNFEQLLETKISQLFIDQESPFLLNQRQYNLILTIEQQLHLIITMLNSPIQYELLSYHLKDALTIITELTGKTISEQGMDAVFREFCVGK